MRLFVLNGSMEGRSFELKEGDSFVGRAPQNDIQIVDTSISRRHLKITKTGKRCVIQDLGSQNGTWIDGKHIDPGKNVDIVEGLPIAMGNVFLTLGLRDPNEQTQTTYSLDLKESTAECRPLFLKERGPDHQDRLEILYEVSTALMQTLEINEICEKIMNGLFSYLKRIDHGAIILIDQKTNKHDVILAKKREGEQQGKWDYSHAIVRRAIEDGKAYIVPDTSVEPEGDLSRSMKIMRLRSVMCVPLISKSGALGVIYAHSIDKPQGFVRDDLLLLSALSIPAALAIENALLYSKRKQAEEALQMIRNDLEAHVEERTTELSKTNALLKQEVTERKQAEYRLHNAHEEIKEANKNLQQAYTRMREAKDRLSSQLFSEEMVILTGEHDEIIGFNEKAMEITGSGRLKLLGRKMVDLLPEGYREGFQKDLRDAWTGMITQMSFPLMGAQGPTGEYQVRVMPIQCDKEKTLLFLLRSLEET